ncbi:MAG: cysteine desulfurase family protein [Saccharofermentanales bacterium]|jgi:cysteine desulfurase
MYDFDTTATSPVLPDVLTAYTRRLQQSNDNPASAHLGGLHALEALNEARRTVARALDCRPDEVFFTSGGTESINTALKGIAWARPRLPKRAVASAGEHDAVLQTMAFLRDMLGYEAVHAPLTADGTLDFERLAARLDEAPTGIVSAIGVSNETGAVEDLMAFVRLVREHAPRAFIHLDLVQWAGKRPFSFRRVDPDVVSISGHKLGAPKGTGLLIKKHNIVLTPLLHGGGQQDGMRSGTVDLPGACAVAEALAYRVAHMAEAEAHVQKLRQYVLNGWTARDVRFRVLSPPTGSPYVLSIAFPGIRGATLMNAVSEDGVMISTGAACGSRQDRTNHVLDAMGVDRATMASAVRISFSAERTLDDCDRLVDAVADALARYAM